MGGQVCHRRVLVEHVRGRGLLRPLRCVGVGTGGPRVERVARVTASRRRVVRRVSGKGQVAWTDAGSSLARLLQKSTKTKLWSHWAESGLHE